MRFISLRLSHILILDILEYLRMKGSEGKIFAIGDCTATQYSATAQVASQQGAYLARQLKQIAKRDQAERDVENLESVAAIATDGEERKKALHEVESAKKQLSKVKLRPFEYSHQGSLAYIGSEKAIADLPFMNGNVRFLSSFLGFFLLGLVLNHRFFLCEDCNWGCRDIPCLAECLPEHFVLPS